MFKVVRLACVARRQGFVREEQCQDLPHFADSATLAEGLLRHWEVERKSKQPRLHRVILGAVARPLAAGASLLFIRGSSNAFVLPLLLKRIIDSMVDGEFDDFRFFLGLLLLERILGAGIEYAGGYFMAARVPAVFMAGVSALVAEKASTPGLQGLVQSGVNPTALIGREFAMLFAMGGQIMRFGFIAIPSLFAGSAALLLLLGWPALLGIAWILFTIRLGTSMQQRAKKVEQGMAVVASARLAKLADVIGAIKAIKYFTWEPEFLAELLDARARECASLRQKTRLQSTSGTLGKVTPVTGSLITFVSFALLGNRIRAGDIFACNSVFMTMRFAVGAAGALTQIYKGVQLAVQRASKLLLLSSQAPRSLQLDDAKPSDVVALLEDLQVCYPSPGGKDNGQVDEKAACGFQLEARGSLPLARQGQLTAVCGAVGSGKSTLLHALVGALDGDATKTGSAKAVESVGWCPQKAFTISGSISDNILLGRDSNDALLTESLADSCLASDLELLENGLEEMVGERGTTLSGGQQARLSLARALYGAPELLVLDDPLAAVDAAVGRALLRALRLRCQRKEDGARMTGVVMAINQLHLLPNFDRIVFIKEGRVEAHGTYAEVQKHESFQEFLREIKEQHLPLDSEEDAQAALTESELSGRLVAQRSMSAMHGRSGSLVQKEDVSTGLVKWSVLRSYLLAPGACFLTSTLVMFAFTYITLGLRDWWLSVWADDGGGQSAKHIGIFVFLCLLHVTGAAVCVWMIGSFAERAGESLHSDCAKTLFRAPMSFFDQTPSGRITSRFGSDLGLVDGGMPMQVDFTMTFGFTLIMMCIGVSAEVPLMLCVFVVAILLSVPVVRGLATFLQDVKRHGNNAMAPILSNLNEAQRGAALATVFGCRHFFLRRHHEFVDYWTGFSATATLTTPVAATWCHSMHLLVLLATGILAMIREDTMRESPGMTAMFFSYAALWGLFADSTMGVVLGLLTNLTSLERLLEYKLGDLPQEPEWRLPADPAVSQWPSAGAVQFKEVVLRYRVGIPPALNSLSFALPAGEKLGIVGRTGAGKSSITVALFRLVDCESGTVFIDGIDVKSVGIHTLREAISMIPQEPIVMSGSVRYNLDPFNKHSTEALQDALSRCGLGSLTLDATAGGTGASLSSGQLQLLTFGRTLLQSRRIIIMDEPTASVDMQTDRLVQSMVREAFADRTVLLIAHRLETVLEFCTRIAVLDAGTLGELGTPQELLANPHGLLAKLAAAAQQRSQKSLVNEVAGPSQPTTSI